MRSSDPQRSACEREPRAVTFVDGTSLAARPYVQTDNDIAISHDVKNVLNPLSLQLEVLRRRIDRGEREAALSAIAEMRQVIKNGVDLVERLRTGHSRAVDDRTLPLDEMVAIAVDLARAQVARAPRLELSYRASQTSRVRVGLAEVVAVVGDIVATACDTAGGTIDITTGRTAGVSWLAATGEVVRAPYVPTGSIEVDEEHHTIRVWWPDI